MSDTLEKRTLLGKLFSKISEVHTRVEHVEECQVVMMDQQRELLAQLEAARVERQKLAATNRFLIECNMRLIYRGSAYLEALGIQEYQRLQRESTTVTCKVPLQLDPEMVANVERALAEVNSQFGRR